jgi:hypothetical protein
MKKLSIVTFLLFHLFFSMSLSAFEILNSIENYNGSKLMFFCGHLLENGSKENPAHADYYVIDLRPDIGPDIAANINTEMDLVSAYFANANRKFDFIVLEGWDAEDPIAFRRNLYDLLAPGGKLVEKGDGTLVPYIMIKAEDKSKFIESDDYTIELDGSVLKKEDLVFLKNNPKYGSHFHKTATLEYCKEILGIEGLSEDDLRGVCAAEIISNYFKLPLDKELVKFCSHIFRHVDDEDGVICDFCQTANIKGLTPDVLGYWLERHSEWRDSRWYDLKIIDFYAPEAFEFCDSVFLPQNYAEIIEKKFSDFASKIGNFAKIVFSPNLEHVKSVDSLTEYYKDILGSAHQPSYFVFLEK